MSDIPLHKPETLASVSAAAASNTEDARDLLSARNAMIFVLHVTADESTVSDTLDVKVQCKVDGVNWIDIVAFTQHTGNLGEKKYVAKVVADAAEAMFTDGALSAGNIRNLLGKEYRVDYTVNDDSGSAAFTFNVYATAI